MSPFRIQRPIHLAILTPFSSGFGPERSVNLRKSNSRILRNFQLIAYTLDCLGFRGVTSRREKKEYARETHLTQHPDLLPLFDNNFCGRQTYNRYRIDVIHLSDHGQTECLMAVKNHRTYRCLSTPMRHVRAFWQIQQIFCFLLI